MTYTQVITKDGKNALLAIAFQLGDRFTFGAFGKSSVAPTEADSHGLGQECSAATELGYARVALSNIVANPDSRSITVEATLPKTNITVATDITEFGIVTLATNGVFFCICQIPKITKTGDISITVSVTTSIKE